MASFSDQYKRLIWDVVRTASAGVNDTVDRMTSDIIHYAAPGLEDHTYEEVAEQVRFYKAAYSKGPTPSGQFSGKFQSSWQQLTSSVPSSSGANIPAGPYSRPSYPVGSTPGTGANPTGGSGGASSYGGGPWPSRGPAPHPGGSRGSSGGGPGGGPGGGGAPTPRPAPGRRGPRPTAPRKPRKIDPWYALQFLPQSKSFLGSIGAAFGAYRGSMNYRAMGRMATRVFGKTVGKFVAHSTQLGQAGGAVVGEFVNNMKNAVVQARAFGEALKESNRRFIYYNASISMSFASSDIADMIRERRMATALAPSIVGLNRDILRLNEINFDRDVALGRGGNMFRQMNVGIAQSVGQAFQPLWQNINTLIESYDPHGQISGKVGRGIGNALTSPMTFWGPAIALGATGLYFGGPWGGVAGLIAGMIPGLIHEINKEVAKPDVDVGVPAGPWETFIRHPGGYNAEWHKHGVDQGVFHGARMRRRRVF